MESFLNLTKMFNNTRKIKFRAFVKRVKRVRGDGDVFSKMEYDIAIDSEGYVLDISCGYDIISKTRFPIMQFTGLQDKNGADIYEGDIVKTIRHRVKSEPKIELIIFENGSFCTKCNTDVTIPIIYHDYEEIEVIGNIYENSKLLK